MDERMEGEGKGGNRRMERTMEKRKEEGGEMFGGE